VGNDAALCASAISRSNDAIFSLACSIAAAAAALEVLGVFSFVCVLLAIAGALSAVMVGAVLATELA
jgi:hypothetical protein